ncbi:10 TM acyl transferase domain found in Cas1p-domain-containing protein [Suillus paluster]|uniref:10 TM acyl transferase domain found in Cas1p-domain-containing protein n=1 Tax=Suillus paluster TaxID=48578 RepID=UPI001B8861F8|nr:10 TM acyl transferase domain found in Cas1p-domain-containing protein [Suillus paluster]KAG1749914.1 10 TM acyl transferase domain found in Cas1p-domain-containing protein [Suillus paluster]
MSSSKRLFSLNPSWHHYVALSTGAFAILAGILHYIISGRADPLHCNSLLTRGTWLDENHHNWQPEGCMLHVYQSKDTTPCLASRRVVFIGDSVTRTLYFQFMHIVDPKLPSAPPDDNHKHSNHSFTSESVTTLDFFWDPYLNTSSTLALIHGHLPRRGVDDRPAMLVLGSGLWYLRYADTTGGLPAWEAKMESLLESIYATPIKPADEVVILPVEDIVPSKLSPARAETMHSSDIDAMNSDLYHRINPPSSDLYSIFSSSPVALPVSLPLVFNKMLDDASTEDGLHFSDDIVKAHANILLNLRCNDAGPKTFPFDKTCCRAYPSPSSLQLAILAVVVVYGPIMWYLAYARSPTKGISFADEYMPAVIFGLSIGTIFIADRTGFWLKEQKQFVPWTFGFLLLSSLVVGLSTMKRGDKDMGFLNRDQTDEWKGWMQVAILVYHYTGASKISGIYNPIRVLVAAYLFMTGYGHTTFYIKKADFGFLRVAQVLVRLNLLTVVLAYTMDVNYLSYYFSPLVSMWYLIVYGTMAIGSQYNDRMPFLLSKILISMAILTWFMTETWMLDAVFAFLDRIFSIHWSAREWNFRVTLDLWIVYFGMLLAIAVIKIQAHRLTDHHLWPMAVKVAVGISISILLWFFGFELMQESKFSYNAWHPYISFLPIAAFVTLRNASSSLRSCSSRAFSVIGRCSLETFIIQYHLWLAGDTKGILLLLPGTRWRPVNFVISTIIFIYISDRVSHATGELTTWICGSKETSLPISTRPISRHIGSSGSTAESVPLTSDIHTSKDGDSHPMEPDTPVRPARRWVDRLAEGTSPQRSPGYKVWYGESGWSWRPGVKVKLGVWVGVMWLANSLWTVTDST